MRGAEKENKATERRDVRLCGCARHANENSGSCDAGKVEEGSILLITANHGGVGVSRGPVSLFSL